MKKYFFSTLVIAAMLFSAVLVSSCDNDDDDDNGNGNGNGGAITNINAAVQGVGSTQITSVKLIYELEDDGVVLATGTFTGGRLQITLPNTVSANLLSAVYFGNGVRNPTNALAARARLIAFNGEEDVGDIDFHNQAETVWAWLIYVDRDVVISSSTVPGSDTWEASFKKGWNFVFETENANGTVNKTSLRPSGMGWYFWGG